MHRALVLCSVAALVGACATNEPAPEPEAHTAKITETLEPYECGTITRLHTMGGLFLASQPAASDFEQAQKGGVRTVVNMRHASEQPGFDEEAFVGGLGLAYMNPAWNGADELTDEVIEASLAAIRSAERPALIHCASGNRVGAIWYVYRALDGGLDDAAALAEARTVGLKSAAYERVAQAYMARHRGG